MAGTTGREGSLSSRHGTPRWRGSRNGSRAAILALALLCGAAPLAAQTPAPSDTAGATTGGVIYTQPKDWTLETRGPATVLHTPEHDFAVAVIDVGQAADASGAAAKAWALFRPEAAPVLRLQVPTAPGNGWSEGASFSYETPPSAQAVAGATALRRGDAWTVVIIDGAAAAASKRLAAISLIQQSLRPAGYIKESFAGKAPLPLTPERVAVLRGFLEESIAALGVPGVGVALIDDGKVVWEGGVGVRKLGSPEPVTAHTKFMVASNTKGMSTLLLSKLADEGKLRWDQPVTELYPDFKLGDEATTRSVLVRHLVCACTGLPRKDFSFILASPDAPATDTFRGLAETQPTSKFGELFQYNNLMASAAGYLGGHLAYPGMELGAAYDKAMDTRIFAPLGMRDSGFDEARAMTGDFSLPHGRDIDGRVVAMSNEFNHTVHPHRPAGGAWSSTHDMARYALLELGKGVTPEGKRVVSEANILERRKPGVQVGEDKWYGMGLFNEIDHGVRVVDHGGTLQGFHSNFWVLPDAGVGAVLLTNSDDGASLLAPFFRRVLEVVYDGEPEAAAQVAAASARIKAAAGARRARLTIPGDPAVLGNLAARYRNPEVGDLTIRQQDGATWMKAGSIDAPLATHRNADGTISVATAGPGLIAIDLEVGGTPGKRTLTMRDAQHAYVYTEVN